MKQATPKRKSRVNQKADSRKHPSPLRKTARTQKTPAGERNDPAGFNDFEEMSSEPLSSDDWNPEEMRAKTTDDVLREDTMRNDEEDTRAAMERSRLQAERFRHESMEEGEASPAFQPPSQETRSERRARAKGQVEGEAMRKHTPLPKQPGEPGSPPRVMQRRKVFERGNRYPLTHAKSV